jgi:hypothetical protein
VDSNGRRKAVREKKMYENYYIYEIGSRKVVEVIAVEEDECPTDGLEYDWSIYAATWNPDGLIPLGD